MDVFLVDRTMFPVQICIKRTWLVYPSHGEPSNRSVPLPNGLPTELVVPMLQGMQNNTLVVFLLLILLVARCQGRAVMNVRSDRIDKSICCIASVVALNSSQPSKRNVCHWMLTRWVIVFCVEERQNDAFVGHLFSVWSVNKHHEEITISIDEKFFVRTAFNSTGYGKRSSSARSYQCERERESVGDIDLALFRYLQAFQKVRDCSQIHEHAGTSARIQVCGVFHLARDHRSGVFLSISIVSG